MPVWMLCVVAACCAGGALGETLQSKAAREEATPQCAGAPKWHGGDSVYGRAQVRHDLTQCKMWNGQPSCCTPATEVHLQKAFQRPRAQLSHHMGQLRARLAELSKLRISRPHTRVGAERALRAFRPVVRTAPKCVRAVLSFVAGTLCIGCNPHWADFTQASLSMAGEKLFALSVSVDACARIGLRCTPFGKAAQRFGAEVKDSGLEKLLRGPLPDASMFVSQESICGWLLGSTVLGHLANASLNSTGRPAAAAARTSANSPEVFVIAPPSSRVRALDPLLEGEKNGFDIGVATEAELDRGASRAQGNAAKLVRTSAAASDRAGGARQLLRRESKGRAAGIKSHSAFKRTSLAQAGRKSAGNRSREDSAPARASGKGAQGAIARSGSIPGPTIHVHMLLENVHYDTLLDKMDHTPLVELEDAFKEALHHDFSQSAEIVVRFAKGLSHHAVGVDMDAIIVPVDNSTNTALTVFDRINSDPLLGERMLHNAKNLHHIKKVAIGPLGLHNITIRIDAPELYNFVGCADMHCWADSMEYTCSDYVLAGWCSEHAEFGLEWDASWGNLTAYARDGIAASQACCQCGGGIRERNQLPDRPQTPLGLLETSARGLVRHGLLLQGVYVPHTEGDEDDDEAVDHKAQGQHRAEDLHMQRQAHVGPYLATKVTLTCENIDYHELLSVHRLGRTGLHDFKSALIDTVLHDLHLPTNIEIDVAPGNGSGTTLEVLMNIQPIDRQLRTAVHIYDSLKTSLQIGMHMMERVVQVMEYTPAAVKGLVTISHIQVEAASSSVLAHAGCTDMHCWKDSKHNSCADYALNSWCNATGVTQWDDDWGTLESYATSGISAVGACCQCGGGIRNWDQLKTWKAIEEGLH